jgi:hypothetical protein
MASKEKAKYKPGDKKVINGVEHRYTQGGHWRDDKSGKLWNDGKPGEPGGESNAPSTMGNQTYLESLDAISGGNIGAANKSLQEQVDKGWISAETANAQKERNMAGAQGGMLGEGLKDIAGGDAAIEKGFEGGAKIGASLFAPGSLGRVDESASADQIAIDARLKGLSEPNVDPLLQGSLDRANKNAEDAQTLNPELQNVLDLRKAALGGLSSDQLLATKEMAQAGMNQSLTSAVRALRVGQGGQGPRGAASNIGTIPLTSQYANSQADLSRQLILDDWKSKQDALGAYSGDAKDIIGGFETNKLQTNQAASNAATNAINDRSTRFNNYVNYNTALRNDLYSRQLQNLNTVAAEKSGQASAIFGGGSFAAQQAGEVKSFELANKNLELQKDIFKNNYSGGGGGGEEDSSTSPGSGDEDTFG